MNYFTGIISQMPPPKPSAIVGKEITDFNDIGLGTLLKPQPAIDLALDLETNFTPGVVIPGNFIRAFAGIEQNYEIQTAIVLEKIVRPFRDYCPMDQSGLKYEVNAIPANYCPQDQSGMEYQINPIQKQYCPQDQNSL